MAGEFVVANGDALFLRDLVEEEHDLDVVLGLLFGAADEVFLVLGDVLFGHALLVAARDHLVHLTLRLVEDDVLGNVEGGVFGELAEDLVVDDLGAHALALLLELSTDALLQLLERLEAEGGGEGVVQLGEFAGFHLGDGDFITDGLAGDDGDGEFLGEGRVKGFRFAFAHAEDGCGEARDEFAGFLAFFGEVDPVVAAGGEGADFLLDLIGEGGAVERGRVVDHGEITGARGLVDIDGLGVLLAGVVEVVFDHLVGHLHLRHLHGDALVFGDLDLRLGHDLDGEHVGAIGFKLFALDLGDAENGERFLDARFGVGGAGEAVLQLAFDGIGKSFVDHRRGDFARAEAGDLGLGRVGGDDFPAGFLDRIGRNRGGETGFALGKTFDSDVHGVRQVSRKTIIRSGRAGNLEHPPGLCTR